MTDGRAFGKIPQEPIFGKMDEERPQHEIPAGCGMVRRGITAASRKTTEFCITTCRLPWPGPSCPAHRARHIMFGTSRGPDVAEPGPQGAILSARSCGGLGGL